jgi:hypothetical protein
VNNRNPILPEVVEHVFGYFQELCWTRRPGYSGPLSLEYQEIEAWCRLTRCTLTQWEVRILMVMDRAYISAIQDKEDSREQVVVVGDADHKEVKEPVYTRPMSPSLFDAMFAQPEKPGDS